MPKHAQVSSDSSIFITSIAEKKARHIFFLKQRKKRTPKDLLIEQEEISKKLYEKKYFAFRRIKNFTGETK